MDTQVLEPKIIIILPESNLMTFFYTISISKTV